MHILTTIWHIIFIAFFFGFAIFIHEFGHLIFAIWRGLHVEKFSIGFGKPIFSFTWHKIVFAVGWLPFGGYVMLPQLDPDEVPKTSTGLPLPPGKPSARALTAFAGPFFNVLFGFVLGTVLWLAGTWQAAPSHSCVVQEVPVILPLYKDGLKLTDTVLAVNGRELPENSLWEEVCVDLPESTEPLALTVSRDGEIQELTYNPEINPEWQAGLRRGQRITRVNGKEFSQGVEEFTKEFIFVETPEVTLEVSQGNGQAETLHWSPAPNPLMEKLGAPFFSLANPLTIDVIQSGSPAEAAGLRQGDQILECNGSVVLNRRNFSERLAELPAGEKIVLRMARGAEEFPVELTVAEEPNCSALGLGFFSLVADSVVAGSPAAAAGVRYGDKILTLDGEEINGARQFISLVRNSGGKTMTLEVYRNGVIMPFEVTPALGEAEGEEVYQIGVALGASNSRVLAHPTPWKQFKDVLGMTGRSLSLIFLPLRNRVKNVVSGQKHELPKTQIGVKHMSGPLGIIMMLWYKLGTDGIRGGLSFIVLITFSLAFVNLLPLPVLDGGHIAYAAIETIIRRRLPVKLVSILQTIFAFLLISLMLYITVFDGSRVWQRVSLWFQSRHPAKTAQIEKPAVTPDDAPAAMEQSVTEDDN